MVSGDLGSALRVKSDVGSTFPPQFGVRWGNPQVPERVLGGKRLKFKGRVEMRVEKFQLKGEKLN